VSFAEILPLAFVNDRRAADRVVVLLGDERGLGEDVARLCRGRGAWVINEIVLVFFAVLTINSLAGS